MIALVDEGRLNCLNNQLEMIRYKFYGARMYLFKKIIIIIALIFFTIGCASQSSINNSNYNRLWGDKYYQETIKGVYIDDDYSRLILLGGKHSYIINSNELMSSYLETKEFIDIRFNLASLVLDENSLLKGKLSLSGMTQVPTHVDSELTSKLERLGIIQYYDHTGLISGVESTGWRLIPRDFYFESELYEVDGELPFKMLDTPLYVKIQSLIPDSTAVKVGKILVTPFSIILDGVVVLFHYIAIIPYAIAIYYNGYSI